MHFRLVTRFLISHGNSKHGQWILQQYKKYDRISNCTVTINKQANTEDADSGEQQNVWRRNLEPRHNKQPGNKEWKIQENRESSNKGVKLLRLYAKNDHTNILYIDEQAQSAKC